MRRSRGSGPAAKKILDARDVLPSLYVYDATSLGYQIPGNEIGAAPAWVARREVLLKELV
jgi:hypothetical protein